MRSFSNIKIRKSPPPVYSMDNPVFDDNTSNNSIVAPSQPVHTRYVDKFGIIFVFGRQ